MKWFVGVLLQAGMCVDACVCAYYCSERAACALLRVHYCVCTGHYCMCTVHYSMCTIACALLHVHYCLCAQYTIACALLHVHYGICTIAGVHSTL